MNNRDYKNFAKGGYYHIYNRGNGKMDIFRDKEDHEFFLARLEEGIYPSRVHGAHGRGRRFKRKTLPEGAFELVSYINMPNHFHLSIGQVTDLPISKLMIKVCTSYSKYFNRKYDRVGSVFQDQFKAVRIENNEQLLWLSAYIHNNPVKAGLCKDSSTYEYSSYREYVGPRPQRSICKKRIIMEQFNNDPEKYKKYVMGQDDGEAMLPEAKLD